MKIGSQHILAGYCTQATVAGNDLQSETYI
jgi:hypothetical protein